MYNPCDKNYAETMGITIIRESGADEADKKNETKEIIERFEFMNILNIEHVSKVFGEKVVLDDVSYGVHQGDKIGKGSI